MKFYLAASFTIKNELREYAKELRKLGHECTSRWLMERADPNIQMSPEDDYRKNAERDVEDIFNSDAFVLFTVDPREFIKRGGKHFEAGYAFGLRKPIHVIGPNENIFYCMNEINHYTDWNNFKEEVLAGN